MESLHVAAYGGMVQCEAWQAGYGGKMITGRAAPAYLAGRGGEGRQGREGRKGRARKTDRRAKWKTSNGVKAVVSKKR